MKFPLLSFIKKIIYLINYRHLFSQPGMIGAWPRALTNLRIARRSLCHH
jgi:hypothetical protein